MKNHEKMLAYLELCKATALQLLATEEPIFVVAQFIVDLRRFPETAKLIEKARVHTLPMLVTGSFEKNEQLRDHISSYSLETP